METSINNNNRKLILAVLFMGWLASSMSRMLINYAMIAMSQEFNFNSSQSGLVFSAYFAGYVLMQIPGGMLADKFNTKRLLMCVMVTSSLFTILTGMTHTITMLLVVRFAFGIAQGSYSPAAMKIIAVEFPKNERGRAISIFMSAYSVCSFILPVFSTTTMAYAGWRVAFYILGAIELTVALLFPYIVKGSLNLPKSSPALSAGNKSTVSFKMVLRQPIVVLLFVTSFCLNIIQWGVNTWIPTYLSTARNLSLQTLGWVATVPAVGSLIGMYLSGIVVDKLKKSGQEGTIAAISLVLCVVLLYMMYSVKEIGTYALCSTLLSVALSPVNIIKSSILSKKLDSSLIGKATGITNTGGQLAGLIVPTAMGTIMQVTNGAYLGAFLFMMLFGVIGAGALLATKKIKLD